MIILYRDIEDCDELWNWGCVENYVYDMTGMYYDFLEDDIDVLGEHGIQVLNLRTREPVSLLTCQSKIDLILQFDNDVTEMLFRLKYL